MATGLKWCRIVGPLQAECQTARGRHHVTLGHSHAQLDFQKSLRVAGVLGREELQCVPARAVMARFELRHLGGEIRQQRLLRHHRSNFASPHIARRFTREGYQIDGGRHRCPHVALHQTGRELFGQIVQDRI